MSPIEGTIIAFDSRDGIGRIQLDAGDVVRVGARNKCCAHHPVDLREAARRSNDAAASLVYADWLQGYARLRGHTGHLRQLKLRG